MTPLLDRILDALCGTRLYEMSRSRDDARQRVTGLAAPLVMHLVKLALCDCPYTTKSHWKREINTYFDELSFLTLKPRNLPVPTHTMREWLWEQPIEPAERTVRLCRVKLARSGYILLDVTDAQLAEFVRAHVQAFCEDNAYQLP